MKPKELLQTQLNAAFRGRPDMPLMAALEGVSDDEAMWRPAPDAPNIEEIVRHIAWSKNRFCQQAFGVDMVIDDPNVSDEGETDGVPWEFPCGCAWGREAAPGVGGAVALLEKVQVVFAACLDGLSEEALEQPLDVHHGKTAFNFFWTMIMHDVFHAGQIRTRRTAAVQRISS